MSEQTYTSQMITQYLLGSLPEAETERLDELSTADDQFVESLQATEKELIDSYVQGELPSTESERFKSHYLASPLRREKVRFARAFQDWAETAGITGVLTPGRDRAPQRHSRSGWSLLDHLRAPRLAWQWGLAAAVLVLVAAGGVLLVQNLRLRQQMAQTQAKHDELWQREQELQKQIEAQRSTNSKTEQELARLRDERERLEQELARAGSGRASPSAGEGGVVSFILAPPLRGIEQVPRVAIPAGTSFVSMQLQLEPNDYAAYRVALLNQSHSQTLWRSSTLKAKPARNGKALSVSFGAGLLKPQTVYALRVIGVVAAGATEVVSDYSFRVVK